MKPHYKLNIDGTRTEIRNYEFIKRVRQIHQRIQSLPNFQAVSLRFKLATGTMTDKQAGALLGLGPTAFNSRKKRGAFPVIRLLALAAARPDLQLNVLHILSA